MSRTTELFIREACLVERTGGCGVDVLAEYGECAPQGEGLEGEDYLAAGTVGDTAYEIQVAAQQPLFDDVAGRREASVIFGVYIGFCHGRIVMRGGRRQVVHGGPRNVLLQR